MKKYLLTHLSKLFAISLLLSGLSSCQKDTTPLATNPTASDRSLRVDACAAFAYADSVFYLQNQTADYVVSPVTALAGKYSSAPWGLSINPTTGAINVSKSETGLTYKIFYVKTGTADTCTRTITVSGVDFASSVHLLAQNDINLIPTYRGRVSKSAISVGGWNFDLGAVGSLLPIRNLGIAIDQLTGKINLKQTLLNGTFGLIPLNGTSRTVRLYYTIDDASKKAINHIDLRFSYYDKLSDVPATLLSKVRTQNARQGIMTAADSESAGARPPDIVIVGR